MVKKKAVSEEASPSQQEDFEKLLAEGKKLYLEEMDNEAALKIFLEAEALAQTREQKADVYFYLSLIHYAASSVEFDRAVRRLIELDYYRELDKLICPPKYLELFAELKKEYGVLRVQSSPPGAEVYVDNQRDAFGLTPIDIGHKAGSINLRLRKGKAEKSDTLSVTAGAGTSSPVYKLKKRSPLLAIVGGVALAGGASALLFLKKKEPVEQKGNIQVNSTPSGAEIFLDGASTGRITNSTLTDVPVGSHTIEVAREGYRNESSTVIVQDSQTATVSVTLTKHTLRVTEPAGDAIWVTGEQVEIKWETGVELSSVQNMDLQLGHNSGSQHGIVNYPSRMDRRDPSQSVSTTGKIRKNLMTTFDLDAIDFTRKANSQHVFNSMPKNTISIHRKLDTVLNKNTVGDSFRSYLSTTGDSRIQALTNVKIQLYKGGTLIETIVDSANNSGLYTWTVSTALQEGTDYSVRVSCVDDPSVSDDSDLFLVTPGYHFITKWGSQGSADGMFAGSILGIAISGYVYVADTDGPRIQKFTTDGTFVGKWGSRGSTDGQFEGPFGIEEDSSGNIFVVDAGNHRIQKFTSNGTHLLSWGEQGNDDGFFHWPYDIAVDNTGNRYVVGQWNNRIQKFASDGTFITKWGGRGSGDGQFFSPTFVAVDQNGFVYVSDTGNHRIQKFDSNGRFVTMWGILGIADGEFNGPAGIATDTSGYVYVCDSVNSRIQKFDSNGKFIMKWGNGGWADGEFGELSGIAVDESGNVYVCDYGNTRIQKFGPNTTAVLNKKSRK